MLRRNDPRHGTANGYGNLRCRCQPCRDAWADAHREYVHRTGRQRPIEEIRAESDRLHATAELCYRPGCKCEAHVRAKREDKRRQRAAYHARGLTSNGRAPKDENMMAALAHRWVLPGERP